MAYIKTTISSNGDRLDFAKALRNFFLNNTVAPFELISEDFTTNTSQLVFTVERNNLNIQVTVGYSGNETKFVVSAKKNEGEYTELKSSTVYHSTNDSYPSDVINRAVQVLLIKNEETVMLQIASYSATNAYKGTTILDTTLTNGLNLIGSNSYSSTTTSLDLKEVETQLSYVPRAFHTGSSDENVLILSNQLAVNRLNIYTADAIGLKSAGGAVQFRTYITDTETYFGVLTDVAIPLGDRVEYTSEATI